MNSMLRTIIDNPSDTGARLAYADWLMERGDPLGEFIAVQCEIAQMVSEGRHRIPGQTLWSKEYVSLKTRESELFVSLDDSDLPFSECLFFRDDTMDIISAYSQAGKNLVIYNRGFPAVIHCTLADWLEHGPTIVAAAPIEEVRLTDREPWRNSEADLWHWWLWVRPAHSADVPVKFRSYWHQNLRSFPVLSYPTESAARADLSHMALQWARHEAGLPKWEGI